MRVRGCGPGAERGRGLRGRLAVCLANRSGRYCHSSHHCLTTPHCSEVLEELRRLMPGRDAEATLLSDPSWLLRVERGRGRLGDDPD